MTASPCAAVVRAVMLMESGRPGVPVVPAAVEAALTVAATIRSPAAMLAVWPTSACG
jgi:hypothetical protein